MVQKYFFIVMSIIGVTLISCREDDNLISQEDKTNLLENKVSREDENQNSANKSDSTEVGIDPNDPPKNGTHWRGRDSIIISNNETTDPPKNGTHWKIEDSIKVSIPNDNTVDPPKNGTHWKIGK